MMNYEAWDVERGVCIYNGGNKKAMENEVADYLEYTNNVKEEDIRYYVNKIVRK